MKDLNFFNIYQSNIKEKKDEKIYVYIAVAIAAAFIFFTFAFNIVKILILNNEIKNYNEELNKPEVKSRLKEAEKINENLRILTEYDKCVTQITDRMKNVDIITDDLLKGIAESVPQDVNLKKIEMSDRDLFIKGTSESRTAVAEMEHNLKETPYFSTINTNKLKLDESTRKQYDFEMLCVIKEAE